MQGNQNLKSLLRSWILLEATRFKKSQRENFPRWQDKLIEYEKVGGYYVHFSSVPRMGLFIRNKWNTPIGFYAYFLNREKIVPFGIDRPYMVVFRPKPEARILDLQTYTEGDYVRDTQRLLDMGFPEEVVRAELPNGLWFSDNMPGRRIWAATRALSGANKLQSKDENAPLPERGGGPTARWTTILHKRLGYDGVTDNGSGIIHPNEEHQAVFFDTTKLELAEVIEKKHKGLIDLEVGDLFGRNFNKQPLRGKDFSGKDLREAKFDSSDLTGAKFFGTNLEQATFHNAKLDRADFGGANLEYARLTDASLEKANFEGASLQKASLHSAVGNLANLRNANLYRAMMNYSSFAKADFRGANLDRASLEEATLEEANFCGADLSDSSLGGAYLHGALYDKSTKFPWNFDPEGYGMVLVA